MKNDKRKILPPSPCDNPQTQYEKNVNFENPPCRAPRGPAVSEWAAPGLAVFSTIPPVTLAALTMALHSPQALAINHSRAGATALAINHNRAGATAHHRLRVTARSRPPRTGVAINNSRPRAPTIRSGTSTCSSISTPRSSSSSNSTHRSSTHRSTALLIP